MGGSTRSNAENGISNDFSFNGTIFKLDFDKNVVWSRVFPTQPNQEDRIWKIIETPDGGFLAGGYSESGIGGVKTEAARGDWDIWILKIDAQGNLLWDKTFGGSGKDELLDMLALPDGGFLLGGHSKSNAGGEKTQDSKGDQDLWMIRTDANGNFLWDETIGGAGREQILDMEFTPDGHVLLLGASNSGANSGDVGPDYARGGMDFWLVKYDFLNRKMLWNRRYGGDAEDVGYQILYSKSGSIYLGGFTKSGLGPQKTADFYGGGGDFWLVKTDANGEKLKDWSFGGAGFEGGIKNMQEDILGNILLIGDTESGISGNKKTNRHGGTDFWIISLDKDGVKNWELTAGGSRDDAPTEIVPCPAGGFYIGGHSESNPSFEKSEPNLGENDHWIVSFCCDLKADIRPLNQPDLCSNEPLTLEARAAGCDSCLWFWSNGEIGKIIELPPGTNDTFSVHAISRDGCFANDTFPANVPLPVDFDLGLRDTFMFEYQSIVVGGNNPELQYKWNTGATSATIVIAYGGVYTVTVTDDNGCTSKDFVKVDIVRKNHVWVPNIFTPNFDGLNDFLYIYADKSVRKVLTFQVADSWGNIYYKRDEFDANYEDDGWDGTHRGKRVAPGVYTWIALVRFIDGKKRQYSGTITLVR